MAIIPGVIASSVRPGTVVPPPSITVWGSLALGTSLNVDQKMTFADNLKVNVVRNSVEMNSYNSGDSVGFLEQARSNHKKVALNINWDTVADRTNSGKHFVSGTNLNTYISRLTSLVSKYQDIILFVTVENEPDNNNYFDQTNNSGDTDNYIEEVRRAIAACHSFSPRVKVADGCCHFQNAINPGSQTRVGRIQTAYKNEWNNVGGDSSSFLDYVNVHGYFPRDNNVFENAVTSLTAAKLSAQLIISNECGLKNANNDAIIPQEATDFVNKLQAKSHAGIAFSIAVLTSAGAGGIAKPFNDENGPDPTALNGNGTAFIAAIDLPQPTY